MKSISNFVGLVIAATSLSQGEVISTLFSSNNGGDSGGAVYFDLEVAGSSLSITGLTSNLSGGLGASFSDYRVYSRVLGTGETALDFAQTTSGWNLVSNGSGSIAGVDSPTAISLTSAVPVAAGTPYGLALVAPSNASHRYTDGDGTNESYSDANLWLEMGGASNIPFTGGTYSPRIWNGSITYAVAAIPEPSNTIVVSLLLLSGVWFRGRRSINIALKGLRA